MNVAQFMLGVVFSAIGFGYFLYAKKQKMSVPFICGIVLMLLSYFIDNTVILTIIGLAVSAMPYFLRF
ncbi:MAG: amino acid transport protein [Acinetobacter sp.]|jgi:C4-dicarboxylate transporter|nr:MAG: amino acid transport protein [Acinetobacter sp.]